MLNEINKQDILKNFKTLQGFNKAIDDACRYIDSASQNMLNNIKLYYNNLFDIDMDLNLDAMNLKSLAVSAISRLKELYKTHPLFIVKFLYERIEANLLYVSQLRKLA